MTTRSLQTAVPEAVTGTSERPVAGDFQAGQVTTIISGHFVHDTYGAFVAPLLPLIQDRLGTSYAATGGLAIFVQLPSLLNPLIGHLADKVSLRYFIILAPAITATLASSLGLTNNYVFLAMLLFMVGISTAAFHAPAPAMVARVSGQRIGTGMSLFMASGELGRTFGPIVVAAAVGWWGLEGIWRLAVVGWLFTGILYWRLHDISARPVTGPTASLRELWPQVRRLFPALIWLTLAKAFMLAAITIYLPIFMRDQMGASLWLAAGSLSILEGAGVVGALATGTLSDRFGRSRILFTVLALAPVCLLAFLQADGWLALPLLVALGLTAISPMPVILALIQDSFPDNRAVANGLYLSFSFLIQALAVWVVGWLADSYGLTTAFLWSGLAAFFSVPAVHFLPKRANR